MLERLDEVDWSNLHHAYGPASDVPQLLRALVLDTPSARDEAWNALYGNVIHQGTVWEATPHVVPFLIEILGAGPDPHRVLAYLAALVENEGSEVESELDAAADPELARHAGATRRARRAVLEAVDLYRGLLASPEGSCRANAARLLALLAPDADAMDTLVDRYGLETDEVAAGALLWSIRLVARRVRRAPALTEPLVASSSLVRLVEALTSVGGGAPSAAALEVVAAVLADPTSVPRYGELPHARFRVELDVAHAVSAAPPFPPGPLLPALLRAMHALSESAPYVASEIVGAIFHLVFEPVDRKRAPVRARPRPIGGLNGMQRDVLREVRAARAMWGPPGRRNGNLGAALSVRRLPSTWEELDDYLRGVADA